MVRRLGKFFAYTAFFLLSLMYFTPKASVYYFLEKEAKKFDVVISKEEVIDSGFSLGIKDAEVSVKAIESANISMTDINIFGVYNSINLEEIILSNTAKSFIPLHVKSASVKYTIFDPIHVNAKADGEFGELDATFNVLERTLHVRLLPSTKMTKSYRSTLRNFKKDENGEYVYDKNF